MLMVPALLVSAQTGPTTQRDIANAVAKEASNENPIVATDSEKKSDKSLESNDQVTTNEKKINSPSVRSSSQQPAADDTAELAKKLANPISSLISFPIQTNLTCGWARVAVGG